MKADCRQLRPPRVATATPTRRASRRRRDISGDVGPLWSLKRGKKVVAVAMDEKHVAMSILGDFEAMLGVMKTWHPRASGCGSGSAARGWTASSSLPESEFQPLCL